MKKLKWMALIAVGWSGLIGCDKTAVVEEPKVENCIEATFLGVGCSSAFFMLKDTTKVAGTYQEVWISATNRFGQVTSYVEKKTKPPYKVFIGLFIDEKAKKISLVEDKTYFFEYRKPNPGERNLLFTTTSCYPFPNEYSQIVIIDTLTSKCTKYQ
jgi:hypothetical protein